MKNRSVFRFMRKIILKTALITLGVVIVLAVAAFGIASLCVPAAMSDLTYSLGMEAISSDYAFQEYERSGSLAYLSRSFELAANAGSDEKAAERFDKLYASDGFGELCEQRDEQTPPVEVDGEEVTYSYRGYVCGLGACVKYRIADSAEEEQAAIDLALRETASDFPMGNPAYLLATEAAGSADSAFCAQLLTAFGGSDFEHNELYTNLVNILEVIADEQNH